MYQVSFVHLRELHRGLISKSLMWDGYMTDAGKRGDQSQDQPAITAHGLKSSATHVSTHGPDCWTRDWQWKLGKVKLNRVAGSDP